MRTETEIRDKLQRLERDRDRFGGHTDSQNRGIHFLFLEMALLLEWVLGGEELADGGGG